MAMCSVWRVGELHASSVGEECMSWRPGARGRVSDSTRFLLLEVLSVRAVDQAVDLDALVPGRGWGHNSRLLRPVGALRAYVGRTSPLRRASQMFVCFGQAKLGLPASMQRLAHWLADVFSASYSARVSRGGGASWARHAWHCHVVAGVARGSPRRRLRCCNLVLTVLIHPL